MTRGWFGGRETVVRGEENVLPPVEEAVSQGGGSAAGREPVALIGVATGGALAGGQSPSARVAVGQGGGLAGGVGATARVGVSQGGGPAGGVAPSARASAAQGGGVAAGYGPGGRAGVGQGGGGAGGSLGTVRITVSQGGAIGGGRAPIDISSTFDSPPPGGALAGGRGPSPFALVFVGGANAAGVGADAIVTFVPGGGGAGGYGPSEFVLAPTFDVTLGPHLLTLYPSGTLGVYEGEPPLAPDDDPLTDPVQTVATADTVTLNLSAGRYYLGAQVDVIFRPARGNPYPKPEWRFVSFRVP